VRPYNALPIGNCSLILLKNRHVGRERLTTKNFLFPNARARGTGLWCQIWWSTSRGLNIAVERLYEYRKFAVSHVQPIKFLLSLKGHPNEISEPMKLGLRKHTVCSKSQHAMVTVQCILLTYGRYHLSGRVRPIIMLHYTDIIVSRCTLYSRTSLASVDSNQRTPNLAQTTSSRWNYLQQNIQITQYTHVTFAAAVRTVLYLHAL